MINENYIIKIHSKVDRNSQKLTMCAVANSANPATSKSSIMAAKTLQNHTKAAAAASAASSGIFLLWQKLIWKICYLQM